jgi:hypothetical protein
MRCWRSCRRGVSKPAFGNVPPQIYVTELKVGTAAEAKQQIKDKGYAEKYLHRGKPITLLGVGFDPEARSIGDWEEEAVAV